MMEKKEREKEPSAGTAPLLGEGALPAGLRLFESEEGLTLTDGTLRLTASFQGLTRRLNKNNLSGELLVRAAGRIPQGEHPLALDATAGLGEDSFLLAAAGFEVILFEHNPVIAALLEDALRRGREDPFLSGILARMSLLRENSREGMARYAQQARLVYLDPMFPERTKSGLIKKKLQLLKKLELPESEEASLLQAARDTGAQRIVIKRPLKGAYLSGALPSYSLKGKAIRYDVYLTP